MKKVYIVLVLTVGLYGSDRQWTATPTTINRCIDGQEYPFYTDGVKEVIDEALRIGTPEALQACLEGKDLTQMRDFNESPMLSAIIDNKPYAIPMLLAAGVPTDICNEKDQTFIDIAKELNHQEIVDQFAQEEERKKMPVVAKSPTNAHRFSPVRFSPFSFFNQK